MHRHRQFDMRENPASDRRHGSRASAEYTVENTIANDEGQSQHHRSMAAAEQSATSHAGPKRPATGEERRKVTQWDAFRLPLLQSDGQFERLLRSEEAAKLLGDIHVKTLQRIPVSNLSPLFTCGRSLWTG